MEYVDILTVFHIYIYIYSVVDTTKVVEVVLS